MVLKHFQAQQRRFQIKLKEFSDWVQRLGSLPTKSTLSKLDAELKTEKEESTFGTEVAVSLDCTLDITWFMLDNMLVKTQFQNLQVLSRVH